MLDRQYRPPGPQRKETDMNQDQDELKPAIPPRRLVLRGALAAGCSLLLPIGLFGCDSRNGENAGGTAPTGSPATGTNAPASAESTKVTQASVQYQDQPKGDQKCDGCLHFIAASNSCKLVEGTISPEGWCVLWAQKS
jgi:hypothetical protein